jgi:hypothetical protein
MDCGLVTTGKGETEEALRALRYWSVEVNGNENPNSGDFESEKMIALLLLLVIPRSASRTQRHR